MANPTKEEHSAPFRKTHSIHHHPAVVRAAVRRAVRIVDARGELARAVEERLSVGEDGRLIGSRDFAIQRIVGDNLDLVRGTVREGHEYRNNLMIAVRAAAL